MNAYAAIQQALRPIGLPCVPQHYTGRENRYIEYGYAVVNGGNFGDDRPDCAVASLQIHLYLPMKENFLPLMAQVREALFDADFTWPQVQVINEYVDAELEDGGIRQPLTDMRHIVFECEYEETL